MPMSQPLIITMGDPTGVGPEIIVKALLDGAFDGLARPLTVAGDPGCLQRAAAVFGVEARLSPGDTASHRLQVGHRPLAVEALSALPAELHYGRPDAPCGRAMLAYIEWACDRCLDGSAAGMVTAPISKAAIHAAGSPFPGHTELLAERCGVEKVVMMLAGSRLRVCLVTTHLALSAVPRVLTAGEILATLRITDAALRRFFGLAQPRLAVLALNPHAGEGGLFGDEEERLIRPAIAAAQRVGIAATGPHSADTLFHFAVQQRACDAVICMYHDQGLIPLKLLHFEDAVNVTLGLPIVRTSVDHGTAYDLAGSGRASAASLVAAVKMAEEMAENR
jgi:4-hydroxythreonine-4-phosphate dehydrogenase